MASSTDAPHSGHYFRTILFTGVRGLLAQRLQFGTRVVEHLRVANVPNDLRRERRFVDQLLRPVLPVLIRIPDHPDPQKPGDSFLSGHVTREGSARRRGTDDEAGTDVGGAVAGSTGRADLRGRTAGVRTIPCGGGKTGSRSERPLIDLGSWRK